MNDDTLRVYLNDHLAGSTLGCDHARQLEEMSAGRPFGPEMTKIARAIEEDRDSLVQLMDALDASRNPVKQAGAWVAEKAGRVKLSGLSSNDPELGYYHSLETMSLGVEAKRCLWTALERVAAGSPALQQADLARLITRATEQREALEGERLAHCVRALGGPGGA